MFEEWVLDDPDALVRADASNVLLDLASAGATVRTAVRLAGESGLDRLRPEGRPRAVLVAGHGTAALAADLFAALAGAACPVLVLRPAGWEGDVQGDFTYGLDWALPGWAGPSDLVLVLSPTGMEPGLVALVEQAYGRGSSVVTVAPAGTDLAEAALQARGLALPCPPTAEARRHPRPDTDLPRETPSTLWGLLTPVLALADRIGLIPVPPASLQAAADQLDEMAVRCGPSAETYVNPAKSLAIQLDGVLPVLWSDGPLTAAVARRFAAMLADQAARPAVTGMLPEALHTQRGLLTGGLAAETGDDDFFRDRTEDTEALRLKLLMLRHIPRSEPVPDAGGTPPGGNGGSGDNGGNGGGSEGPGEASGGPLDEEPAASRRTLARARRLADDHQVAFAELSTPHRDVVRAMAELVALTDFAAVYLTLAASGAPDLAAGAAAPEG
ncbi:SIS domain-containing protein [Streptacidiphilus sp. EB129]|uniref:SIS domain-containing protein n=1 Tax=Streptacidiphilus sp. EB129 TaxID=3156262 RepID=UPI00351897DF